MAKTIKSAESHRASPMVWPTTQIGREIIHLATTTSTNDEIENLMHGVWSSDFSLKNKFENSNTLKRELPTAEGLVVWADEQTRGRGRMGRTWASRRGKDLLFSVLLRPSWPAEAMTRLTVLAAVAVARVVEQLEWRQKKGAKVTIKWPNDVLLGGRKVAGILVEIKPSQTRTPVPPNYCILGIGLNVNSTTRDFSPELRKTATSLRIATGKSLNREELLRAMLTELDAQYHRAQDDFSSVADEWARRCGTLGKFVVASVGNRRTEGTAWKLDDDGALIVRTESGRQERIVGGDVILEKDHE